MTFFSMFDVPVFWPILLVYFVALFGLTMRNQIAHMLKHKYIPFSWGKARYGGGPGGAGGKGKGGPKGGGAAIPPSVGAAEAMFKGSTSAAR